MSSNSLKTFIFLTVLTAFFLFIGGLIGGHDGVIIAFGLAMAMNFFSYWFSSSIVLRMYSARIVSEAEQPLLYGIIRDLAAKAGLPMPKVAIVEDPAPNAFATGRNYKHAVVSVTAGIIKTLDKDELAGVIAHELSHVKSYDMLIGTIAATVAGAIMMLANMVKWAAILGGGNSNNRENNNPLGAVGALLVAIIAPIAAMLIQMAISRTREYEADASAAKLTKQPLALASALQKISKGVEINPTNASPATAHMFIMNPFSGKKTMNLFSTHPNVEDRIQKLKDMDMNGADSVISSKKRSNPMFK